MATQANARHERLNLSSGFNLLKEAAREFGEDKVPRLGAALAYYTVFSLAPLLIIVIAIVGLVLGQQQTVQTAVVDQLRGLVGQAGADLVQTAIESARKPAAGILATVFSVITLVLGALGAFGQLQDALNTIWEVKPKPERGLAGLLRDRLLSAGMVLVIGFLLLVSLVLSAALTAAGRFLGGLMPGLSQVLLQLLNLVVSFGVITLLFALLFKYLPDAKIAWRDVWIGALITALLFTLGKFAIGLYLGNASFTSAYGAAGSLVVLLVWVYYSAQIVFFGAEITQAYANRFGSRVVPAKNAERVSEAERANQGMPHEAARQPQPTTALVRPPQDLVTAEARGEPAEAQQNYLVALLTFAAGLGAGAAVAVRGRQPRRRR